MTKELIIHIGSHKTGTTTLQRTFMTNKDKLLQDHGIAYMHAPQSEHMHPFMGFDHDKGMVPHGFKFTEMQAMGDMLCMSDAPVTLVSSENFSFVFDLDQMRQFHAAVKRHFDKIRVVAYLRRQDSHMVSHHQEGAKPRRAAEEKLFGSEPKAIPTYRPHFDLYLDYAERLSKWQKAFGKNSVQARVFERDRLRDGDIVSDFLSLLDLPANAIKTIEDQNTASGFVRAKVGHMINQTIAVEELKAFLVNNLPNEGRLLPSRAEAEAFYSNYADSNRRLNKMFNLSDQPEVFNLDFSNYPETPADHWTEETGNAAIMSLLGSVEDLLQGLTTNDLRDAAFDIEDSRPVIARRLMTSASKLRPSGTWIRQRLKSYGPPPK